MNNNNEPHLLRDFTNEKLLEDKMIKKGFDPRVVKAVTLAKRMNELAAQKEQEKQAQRDEIHQQVRDIVDKDRPIK